MTPLNAPKLKTCPHGRYEERLTYDGQVEWSCMSCGLAEKAMTSAEAMRKLLLRVKFERFEKNNP